MIDIYRERAYLLAFLATQFMAVLAYNDPAEPTWPVLYLSTYQGQLSWHISPDDLDLFSHVPLKPADWIAWDGHSTEEKYNRLQALTFREAG